MNAPVAAVRGAFAVDPAANALDGWVLPDPDQPGPSLVAIESDGRVLTILRADREPGATGAPAGALGFSWPIPSTVRGSRTALPLRLWDLATGKTLAGPPALPAFPAEPPPAGGAAEPAGWPAGLTGPLALGLNEVATGCWVETDPDQQGARFERADAPPLATGQTWALRIVQERPAPLTVHQTLDPLLAATGELRLVLKLAQAVDALSQCHAQVFLSRRSPVGFERLRRLKRSRVFRQYVGIDAAIALDEAERAEAAQGLLAVTVAMAACPGIVIAPPVAAPATPIGLQFEDDRLTGAFAACRTLTELHNPALGDTILPGFDRSSLGLPRAGVLAPFTQIIIPVYNGGDVIDDCLRSVQERTDTPFQVLLVDDGSRAYTTRILEGYARRDPRFILHHRDINRGYTKSVNEGIKLTGADWVVVLNSDTVLSQGWLGRLHAAAGAVPGAGLVGALSNAATWQSIPRVKNADNSWSTNDFIDSSDVAVVQARLAAVSERAYPEMPVLNGFCTLIARAVFERCGLLDDEAFPIGYGEETDLCFRAGRAGYKLIVADDCFVYHQKSVSFGSAARSRLTRAGGFELRNKHVGVTIPALERRMQDAPAMARLRTRLLDLEAELG